MRTTFFLVAICSIIFSVSASAKTVSANSFLSVRTPAQTAIASASYFTVNQSALEQQLSVGGHIEIVGFPCGGNETISLELKQAHSAIDTSTECIVTTPDGDRHIAPPVGGCFSGSVLGEAHSRIFLSTLGGMIVCSILRENGTTYVFGPEKNSTDNTAYILLRETDLLSTAPFAPFNCINDALVQPNTPSSADEALAPIVKANHIQSGAIGNGKLLQTDIAVEADSQFYGAIGGDPSKTLAYIGALFGMSSFIYEEEAGLTHHLTWIKVWTTSDPYQVKGNAYALPDTVRSYWQLHYSNVQRDIAHVMTSISYGGGGFGYYSLCDPTASYSVSSPQTGHQYPTFAFTYDAYIVSHEIGHNFGLRHTHDCWWNPAIDTCYTKDDATLALADACYSKPIVPHKNPGSIMSYCATANYTLSNNDFSQFKCNMTFLPKPDSIMRAGAEGAACITPPTSPVVILLYPEGGESFKGDSMISLKWTYANVQNVALDYSTNSGSSWSPISAGVPAASGTLSWKVANVTTAKMLVRILDASGSSAGDTSLLNISVTQVVDAVAATNILTPTFLIVPNPSKDFITLTTTATVGVLQCDIINELGVSVKHIDLTIPAEGYQFDVRSLARGNYFLHIQNQEGIDQLLRSVLE